MLRALSPVRSAIPATRPTTSAAGPRLRIDALAWLKMQFFATTWDCAIGGFGLSGGDDPLHIHRFVTVPQQVTFHTVELDGPLPTPSRARRRRRRSRPRPQSSSDVLILTHPGTDATPTDVDEASFTNLLGHRDWSVLVILARDGAVGARLSLRAGPVRSLSLPVDVDWSAWARFVEDQPHQLSRMTEGWKDEYARNIRFADAPEEAQLSTRIVSSRQVQLFGDHPPADIPAYHRSIPVHYHR